MINEIQIENFTAFGKIELSLSPRVNVIIGSNGTGKTHLLKAIYGLGLAAERQLPDQADVDSASEVSKKFLRVFSTEEDRLGSLHAKSADTPARMSLVNSNDSGLTISFGSRSKLLQVSMNARELEQESRPIYIPTKEVLSLVRGMHHRDHDRATVEMIFDDTYIDLAELLVRPSFDEKTIDQELDPRLSSIISDLVTIVGGRYQLLDSGAFRFEPGNYEQRPNPSRSSARAAQVYQDSTITRFVRNGDQSFSAGMTAEGYRKIGVLHRLLCNGSINPGTTGILLWDEPEANLNPRLMKKLVQVLLEISRNGQQIVLATHDYVLLKWFDLLMDKEGKEDHVRFHVLHRQDADKSISVYPTDDYDQLINTGISKTFSELYDAEIERSLQGVNL